MNTGGKIGIGIGSIIGIIVVIFIFTNIDDLFSNEIEEFASEVEITNPAYPNKINDECELVNFLNSPSHEDPEQVTGRAEVALTEVLDL